MNTRKRLIAITAIVVMLMTICIVASSETTIEKSYQMDEIVNTCLGDRSGMIWDIDTTETGILYQVTMVFPDKTLKNFWMTKECLDAHN